MKALYLSIDLVSSLVKVGNLEWLAAVIKEILRHPLNFSVIVLLFILFSFIFMNMQMRKFVCHTTE